MTELNVTVLSGDFIAIYIGELFWACIRDYNIVTCMFLIIMSIFRKSCHSQLQWCPGI